MTEISLKIIFGLILMELTLVIHEVAFLKLMYLENTLTNFLLTLRPDPIIYTESAFAMFLIYILTFLDDVKKFLIEKALKKLKLTIESKINCDYEDSNISFKCGLDENIKYVKLTINNQHIQYQLLIY